MKYGALITQVLDPKLVGLGSVGVALVAAAKRS
jgi:hypothetical protein